VVFWKNTLCVTRITGALNGEGVTFLFSNRGTPSLAATVRRNGPRQYSIMQNHLSVGNTAPARTQEQRLLWLAFGGITFAIVVVGSYWRWRVFRKSRI